MVLKSTEYMRNYRKNNPDYVKRTNDKRNKNRLKNKIIVMNHYSKGLNECDCCKINIFEFLTIDHIGGGGHKHRKFINKKPGVDFYKWLIDNNFPLGFRVLCFNCNSCLGFYGYCPHESNI